jgi:flagellar biosynthesis protein FliR
LFDTLTGFLEAATKLALRLAAPMLVTMLVVDLALGLVGRIMPQMNVMAMGMSLRSALGLVVVILGLAMTNDALRDGVAARWRWSGRSGYRDRREFRVRVQSSGKVLLSSEL